MEKKQVEKIGILRAVKTLNRDMYNVAKNAGYNPDDVVFLTIEKVDGSIVEWQRKNGLIIREVVKKQIDIDEVLRRLHTRSKEIWWYEDSYGQADKSAYEWCISDLEDIIGSMRVD
jgi:hypothetical protein